jgi:hypothetical protein
MPLLNFIKQHARNIRAGKQEKPVVPIPDREIWI